MAVEEEARPKSRASNASAHGSTHSNIQGRSAKYMPIYDRNAQSRPSSRAEMPVSDVNSLSKSGGLADSQDVGRPLRSIHLNPQPSYFGPKDIMAPVLDGQNQLNIQATWPEPAVPYTLKRLENTISDKIRQSYGSANLELKRVFKNLNFSSSPYLSYQDFRDGLCYLHIALTDQEFTAICQQYDPHKRGRIDMRSFLSRVAPKRDDPTIMDALARLPDYKWRHTRQEDTWFTPSTQKAIAWDNFTSEHPPSPSRFNLSRFMQQLRDKIQQRTQGNEHALRTQLLRQFGIDGEPYLSPEQLRRLLTNMHLALDNTQFQAVMAVFDPHNTGRVNIEHMTKLSMPADYPRNDFVQKEGMLGPLLRGHHRPFDNRPPAVRRSFGINSVELAIRDKINERCRGSGPYEVRTLFKHYDQTGKSSISYAEFRKTLNDFNINVTDAEFRDLMAQYDPHMRGVIDMPRFVSRVMPDDFRNDTNALISFDTNDLHDPPLHSFAHAARQHLRPHSPAEPNPERRPTPQAVPGQGTQAPWHRARAQSSPNLDLTSLAVANTPRGMQQQQDRLMAQVERSSVHAQKTATHTEKTLEMIQKRKDVTKARHALRRKSNYFIT